MLSAPLAAGKCGRAPNTRANAARASGRRVDAKTRHGDAGSPILGIKSRFPGVSRPAISVFRVPHFTDLVLPPPPLAARQSRRPGRSAGRAGNSASSPLPRRQVSPPAGVGLTPFAKTSRGARIGSRTPRAPLPARKPGTDLPDLPFDGGNGKSIGICSGICQEQLNFASPNVKMLLLQAC